MKNLCACVVVALLLFQPTTARSETGGVSIRAYVTGFNTTKAQTDNTPCVAAGGYICGRDDVVACPRNMSLHAWVEIDGKQYECMDRTTKKYNNRFDISCDKDTSCPYDVVGWYTVKVL